MYDIVTHAITHIYVCHNVHICQVPSAMPHHPCVEGVENLISDYCYGRDVVSQYWHISTGHGQKGDNMRQYDRSHRVHGNMFQAFFMHTHRLCNLLTVVPAKLHWCTFPASKLVELVVIGLDRSDVLLSFRCLSSQGAFEGLTRERENINARVIDGR